MLHGAGGVPEKLGLGRYIFVFPDFAFLHAVQEMERTVKYAHWSHCLYHYKFSYPKLGTSLV